MGAQPKIAVASGGGTAKKGGPSSGPADSMPYTPDPEVERHFDGGSAHLSNTMKEQIATANYDRSPTGGRLKTAVATGGGTAKKGGPSSG